MADIKISALPAVTDSSALTLPANSLGVTSKVQTGIANGLPYLDGSGLIAPTSAMALYAPLASPALTGIPTAPTAALATNTTQLATTAFVIANAGTGSIGGAATAGQVAYGSGANTITSEASFVYDDTTHRLKVGSSTGTIDAPLHVRANSSELIRMETGTTFPVYMQGKNFLADNIGRVEFGTVSNRGGVFDLSTKPADNVQGTAAVKRLRVNASGNLGLGNINQINERLSVSSHTGFSNSALNFATAGVSTVDNTPTLLWSKTLDDETVSYIRLKFIARRTDSGNENARFSRDFLVYRSGGGGATLGATVVTPYADEQLGMTGAITIGVSSNDIQATVTGENAKTIAWVVSIEYQTVFTEF